MRISTIDAHVGGAALRLVVEGAPDPGAGPLSERLESLRTAHDAFRRVLMLEPRGHGAMSGALAVAPARADPHLGVIFMHAGGWSAICGHGLIAVATIAAERGLFVRPLESDEARLDTAAGEVTVRLTRAAGADRRVTSAAWSGVPAAIVRPGLPVRLARRPILVDVARAAETYAIVDSEACGVPLDRDHVPELVRAGREIVEAVEHAVGTAVEGAVFTGPPEGDADLRAAAVCPDGAVDRSPGGLATCAVMAVLDAMGLLTEDRALTLESLIGTRLTGRIRARTTVDDAPAIVPEIEGRAFVTGEHTFVIDDDDPLRDGFVF